MKCQFQSLSVAGPGMGRSFANSTTDGGPEGGTLEGSSASACIYGGVWQEAVQSVLAHILWPSAFPGLSRKGNFKHKLALKQLKPLAGRTC